MKERLWDPTVLPSPRYSWGSEAGLLDLWRSVHGGHLRPGFLCLPSIFAVPPAPWLSWATERLGALKGLNGHFGVF